jgi:cellulose 1,4-beta-cellobiosidase
MGNTTFLGEGMTVDTIKTITVVTQFLTSDNTTSGDLSEIRRIYVQDGKVIQNSFATALGLTQYNSISNEFCTTQKSTFGGTNKFAAKGSMAVMGDAFQKPLG